MELSLMDCSLNRCCALDKITGSRCSNNCSGLSDHCENHRPDAVRLYNKYKKLHNQVDKLDLNKKVRGTKNRIEYLMDCYVLLNKTYDARMTHREYAYVPECYDEGHDYQFTKLKKLISQCENMLSSLNDSFKESLVVYAKDEEDEEESFVEPVKNVYCNRKETIRAKIKRFNKHRNELEDWIRKYNEENKVILERRFNYISLIVEHVRSLYEEKDENLFLINVSIFNMARKLYSIGYFNGDFKANKCEQCNCGAYIPYDVRLICSCIVNNNTIQKYFNLCTEDVLKFYHEILINNNDKIKPLVNDLKILYKKYEHGLFTIRLWLDWDPTENRLKLVEKYLPPQTKLSKLLAMNRRKNEVRHLYN